jgi:hypothetical protein
MSRSPAILLVFVVFLIFTTCCNTKGPSVRSKCQTLSAQVDAEGL